MQFLKFLLDEPRRNDLNPRAEWFKSLSFD